MYSQNHDLNNRVSIKISTEGIYFLKIETNDDIFIKKVIVIRR